MMSLIKRTKDGNYEYILKNIDTLNEAIVLLVKYGNMDRDNLYFIHGIDSEGKPFIIKP